MTCCLCCTSQDKDLRLNALLTMCGLSGGVVVVVAVPVVVRVKTAPLGLCLQPSCSSLSGDTRRDGSPQLWTSLTDWYTLLFDPQHAL